jgi:hypothetical protein
MRVNTGRTGGGRAITLAVLMVAVFTVSVGYGVVLPRLPRLIERLLGARRGGRARVLAHGAADRRLHRVATMSGASSGATPAWYRCSCAASTAATISFPTTG